MGIEESKIVSEVLEGLAETTQMNYKTTLKQFLRFINSGKDVSRVSIDDVIREVEVDTKLAQEHIDNFYKWLQDKEIEGYKLRGKGMKESSAFQRAYVYLIGFFANLDITFGRKWKRSFPKPERKQAIKKDKDYTFYDVDEKTRTIRFNREFMQQFLSNLKLREQAITLALLSSGQDSGDLFKLKVSDIRDQTNNRFFWEGYRGKSKIQFRTFFSKEATRFVRRYLEQERKDASDKEPLFVANDMQMSPQNLASIYRDAGKRMGIKWNSGEFNPLRPKRMRHLFRTGCDTAGITELYTNCYMGHKNSQGLDYSELSKAKLELEYLRVEPFLTVYGEVEESLEVKEDVKKLETRVIDLNREIERQARTIDDLSRLMESKIEAVTARIQKEYFAKLFEETFGSTIKELVEFIREQRKKKQNSSEP